MTNDKKDISNYGTLIIDSFQNIPTSSFFSDPRVQKYHQWIIFKIIEYYNNKNVEGNNSTKKNIIKCLHHCFEDGDINYDELKRFFHSKSDECILAYMLIAFNNADLDLMLKCTLTFGRILPTETSDEWFDNHRLDGFGNKFNMIEWKDYDFDNVYTVDYTKAPINNNVQLDFKRIARYLVGSVRTFIINNGLYPEEYNKKKEDVPQTKQASISVSRYKDSFDEDVSFVLPDTLYVLPDASLLSDASNEGNEDKGTNRFESLKGGFDQEGSNDSYREICDKCYERYPFYYGGCHGCDVFRTELSLTLEELKRFLDRYPSAHIGYILNTMTYASGRGEHWIALELTKGKAKIICSQGSDFTAFHDGGYLVHELDRLGFGREYNMKTIQKDNFNCGLYSVLSLLKLLDCNSNIDKAVNEIGVNAMNLKNGFNIFSIRSKVAGSNR